VRPHTVESGTVRYARCVSLEATTSLGRTDLLHRFYTADTSIDQHKTPAFSLAVRVPLEFVCLAINPVFCVSISAAIVVSVCYCS